MRLLIIRHGDPDYEHDSLTPKGFSEASFLAERLKDEPIDEIFCSPLGRAQATAAPTLQARRQSAETCDWLREFEGHPVAPEEPSPVYSWDRTPAFLAKNDDYYSVDHWLSTPFYASGNVAKEAERVWQGLDKILLAHGYRRDGHFYRVERESHETLAFFCHFGVECVMLSHLLNIAAPALWHGFVALPSSVTTLFTEEREAGQALWRCTGFGDLSHLYAHREPPSFQARFCEAYSDFDQRH